MLLMDYMDLVLGHLSDKMDRLIYDALVKKSFGDKL